MKRDKILRSKQYWLVKIQNDLYGVIEKYMKKNNLNRTDLAEELGVTKGYVTQVLNGDFDHKLSKLVDLSLSCNQVPIISFLDLDQYIKEDGEGKPHYLDNRHLPKNIEYNFYFYKSINPVIQEQKTFTKKETKPA